MMFSLGNYDCAQPIFKYRPQAKKEAQVQVCNIIRQLYPDYTFSLYDSTENVQKYLQSKNISVDFVGYRSRRLYPDLLFGYLFARQPDLPTTQKKEIALRNIFGTNFSFIFGRFNKEYLLLLFLSALIAFTDGYSISKPWTKHYIQQTPIPPALFSVIFLLIACCLLPTVCYLIWQAVSDNPANIIKSE